MTNQKEQYFKLKVYATQIQNQTIMLDFKLDRHCGLNFYVSVWESILNDPENHEMLFCIETAISVIKNKKTFENL